MYMRFALAGILLIQLLTACSQSTVKEQSVDVVLESSSDKVVNARPEVVEKTSPVKIKPVIAQEKSVAILLARMTPDYQIIVDTIEERFAGKAQVYILNDSTDSPDVIVSSIQSSSHRYVAAIGEFATKQALKLEGKHIAFAEVFTFDITMLEKGMVGVSMLPNPDKLFLAWKSINPELERVAILTGPGCEDQIKVIRESAQRYKVELVHREVNNDKDMLYQSEKLISSVQGYWMLPDHRILSRRAMKDFMSLSLKKSKQVAVFNRELLDYGGLIYIEAAPEDIAAKLVDQLNSKEVKLRFSTEVTMLVNPVIAQKLSLDLSQAAVEILDTEQRVQ
jgi:ABC-type uncharacterized transport system substrate-binding protein